MYFMESFMSGGIGFSVTADHDHLADVLRTHAGTNYETSERVISYHFWITILIIQ